MNPDVLLERPAEVLAVDDDVVVRRWLARRRGVGLSILDVLAVDGDATVRSFVARNTELSDELARVLAEDHWSVQVGLLAQFGRWGWLDEHLRASNEVCIQEVLAAVDLETKMPESRD